MLNSVEEYLVYTQGAGGSNPSASTHGKLPERLIGHAWNACVGQPTGGSNPSLSAHHDGSSLAFGLEETQDYSAYGGRALLVRTTKVATPSSLSGSAAQR
jgi:hypothetical protein